jgi:hypothetical protein
LYWLAIINPGPNPGIATKFPVLIHHLLTIFDEIASSRMSRLAMRAAS